MPGAVAQAPADQALLPVFRRWGTSPPRRRRFAGVQNNNSTDRGQAPQNSKLAELRPEYFQRLVPPILSFAVPDPGQMLFCTRFAEAIVATSRLNQAIKEESHDYDQPNI